MLATEIRAVAVQDHIQRMKSITWYMARQVASVTIFVTVTLCFAIWLTKSLRLIDLILNRGLPVSTFLYMATLLLPRFLIIVVPIAAFCAPLFNYNKMISDKIGREHV